MFTKAIAQDLKFERAYFNRGLAYIKKERKEEAMKDLSTAGGLGVVQAYSILKKYNKEK